ncbi:MAG: MopE-related protein [Myxococcota bacterium]
MGAKFLLPSVGLVAAVLAGCGPTTEIVDLAPPQLELSTKRLEFGEVAKGDKLDKEIFISNGGDVPLGVESIFLSTSEDPDSGHPDAFRLFWNCGDVQTPDLGEDDEGDDSTAREGAGNLDSGTPGSSDPVPEDEPCVIPAGGRLPVKVRFNPKRAGGNRDSIIVTTYGEDTESDEAKGKAIEDLIRRDVNNTWKQIYLIGEGGETTPQPLIAPKTLDMGFVFEGQDNTQYFSIRNAGDGELEVLNVDVDYQACRPGFFDSEGNPRIEVADAPFVISGDQARVVAIGYVAPDERPAQCRIQVETRDPNADDPDETELLTTVLVVANTGTNPSNEAPTVIIHSPAPGYQHRGLDPLPLELTIRDQNEPADNLYCKVRSALQGIPDGRPALADCRAGEGNVSGHRIVDIPVDSYVKPGLEVLLVRVTDSSGVTREASVPVLLNDAFPASDDDGDGFGTTGIWKDCDDTNADVYPLAAEAFDGRDNDCDRLIDEGTDGFDDDGDGQSEAQGDCDDASVDTYKGAPEVRDQADNDCDGIIDENTIVYDDDGDGFTELESDCDDTDPTINPNAVEICGDRVDNDCDQIPDESDPGGCVSNDSEPMIVGRIDLSPTSIEEGETMAASVLTYEDDGDSLAFEWEVNGGEGTIDDPAASTINWSSPAEVSDADFVGDVFKLRCMVRDDDGNQNWKFEEVWMYQEDSLDVSLQKVVEVERSGGCSSVPVAPVGFLAGFGLLFAGLRRRRN